MKKTQMTYEQIKEVFYNTEKMNKCYGIDVHFEAEITFTQDSFTKEYSEEARTYVISSNNKAFIIDGKHLKSINQYYNKQIAHYSSIKPNNKKTISFVFAMRFNSYTHNTPNNIITLQYSKVNR